MSKAAESSERRRARLVARWRTSGETRVAFARRHGVHPRTFWGWCRAEDPPRAAPERRATFLPVRVVNAVPSAPAGEVEVVLTSGDRVYLRGEPTRRLLAHAVAVLRCPC